MSAASHDTLVHRLSLMLLKLNQGESLDPRLLAEEFGVNVRTIQRDLNERFTYLPLQRAGSRYVLDPAFLGNLSKKDIEAFAALSGVQGLFPTLSDEFLRDVFDARMQRTILVRGHHHESMVGREFLFRQLQHAVAGYRLVSFRQLRTESYKVFEEVEPYKLLNHKGVWYLAAKHDDRLKTFAISSIENLLVSDEIFSPDSSVEAELAGDGLWMGSSKLRVVLNVSREVARFFKRRPLLVNQEIVSEQSDGGLVVATTVGHENEVLPQVRYWIPHVRIVSPEALHEALEKQLDDYINDEIADGNRPRSLESPAASTP